MPAPRPSRPRRCRLLVVGSQPGELDAGCFADQTASSVAPDEIVARSDRPSDSSTSTPVSSCAKPGHLHAVVDRHPSSRPSRPGCARCGSATARARVCAGWEVADVQRDPGEARDLSHLPLREKAVGDPR
jgi:hypothetical protein